MRLCGYTDSLIGLREKNMTSSGFQPCMFAPIAPGLTPPFCQPDAFEILGCPVAPIVEPCGNSYIDPPPQPRSRIGVRAAEYMSYPRVYPCSSKSIRRRALSITHMS